MAQNVYATIFLSCLLGSTLAVIPEGEIQIGPVFGKGSRFFGGHKHFEAVFEKGANLKPLIAKKVLLGAGALGVGALAAGGAALLANKFPHLTHGWGQQGWGQGYAQGQQNYNSVPAYGWGNSNSGSSSYYPSSASDVKFPATSGYPSSSYYGNANYNIPSTEYGYPQSSGGSADYGSYGWSR
ncbi:hypothetical protein Ocin01_10506 [Orchesella cincta]|uniref:Uncharacterized protein n=1 Tax=Orchesella cincta TaxID=48709 RepID=A0A1D2MSW9_ORCCI|nr:hypothetical protein Ocin01_10506 [Orchesella cincta]